MIPQVHKNKIFKTITTTIELTATSETNTKGYIRQEVEIPTGYVWIGTSFSTSSISDNTGLQLTNVTQLPMQSGTKTMWVEYFAPNFVNNDSKSIIATLLLVKENLI